MNGVKMLGKSACTPANFETTMDRAGVDLTLKNAPSSGHDMS